MDQNEVEKHAAKPRAEMRRKDYELTDPTAIKKLLADGDFGVLATAHEDQPYATPVNYIYIEADQAVYFHGARAGRTRANIALNPKVCFNVPQMGELVPGERSSNFGVEYQSVTVFGTVELVTDEDKIISVLLALMRKYFPEHVPGEDYPLPQADELKRTAVYRIDIEEWSAKEQ
ncbi:MAG: pyridoxamine 5'-phosphate oxidase family protein [Anaerolineales bacterium]|nr:pyridoxamine 5'-phosphate oxidase family protein [Anaerolineales bacterium]